MRTDELDYTLPDGLIATRPAPTREAARLLVCSRSDPGRVEHRAVADLHALLDPGDLLAVNTSRVLPARMVGSYADSGGAVECLYLRDATTPEGLRWVVLLRARRSRPGRVIMLRDRNDEPSGVTLELVERADEAWVVTVQGTAAPTPGVLDRVGRTPLPPYIRSARKAKALEIPEDEDRDRYRTVYQDGADRSAPVPGSVAAPTAGLHLTPALLDAMRGRGIDRAEVTLHVGTGTFRPVEAETLEDHPMHAEWCSIDAQNRRRIFGEPRRRLVAVGTTSARTIEAFAALPPTEPQSGGDGWMETDLLVSPGYEWRRVEALLTNFHLPRSTLLAMVGALFPQGVPRLLELYAEAIGEGYRFYSYGDAMLVLP